MLRWWRRRLYGRAALLCLGLYAAVLLVSPVLHHDFDCHLKSPRHCQACVANPLAQAAQAASGLGAARLADVGRHLAPARNLAQKAAPLLLAGRAPPQA